MPQYMFFYLGGELPASPQEGQKHFEKYQQWLDSLGDAVVSAAIPFKDTHTVHPNREIEPGTSTAMSGLSIFKMNSLQEALAVAKECPFLDINGTLEVSEMIEMSDEPDERSNDKLN